MIRFVRETKGLVEWLVAALLVLTGLFVNSSPDAASGRAFNVAERSFNRADAATTQQR